MRRRFGRGRKRGTSDGEGATIDANRAFERIAEAGLASGEALTPATVDDIPADFAVVATGGGDEPSLVVGYAPGDGGNAILATLAYAQRLADDAGFTGHAVAIAPQWSIAARRRLSLLGDLPFQFRALAASALAEGETRVQPELGAEPPVVAAHRVAAGFDALEEPDLFRRALAAFEGLAAKHGGAVRGYESGVELILMARCVAVLGEDAGAVVMETRLPERSRAPLNLAGLATDMDRLEGSLRRRLNDRRARSSEEGLRAQLVIRLAAAADVRSPLLWPMGGSDVEVLDLAGIDAERRPVVGAVRSRLNLAALGSILDAALALRPALSGLLPGATPALRSGPPRMLGTCSTPICR